MQKVVYSISKVNKDEKLKGVGYLVEGNLLIPSTSQKGNAYIRVFEDVAEKCKAVANSDNEFKGYVTVAYEVLFGAVLMAHIVAHHNINR